MGTEVKVLFAIVFCFFAGGSPLAAMIAVFAVESNELSRRRVRESEAANDEAEAATGMKSKVEIEVEVKWELACSRQAFSAAALEEGATRHARENDSALR